ncbi:MAG: hypothetical protein ACRC5M_05175 [Anaeroplasmataceae bacterium]
MKRYVSDELIAIAKKLQGKVEIETTERGYIFHRNNIYVEVWYVCNGIHHMSTSLYPTKTTMLNKRNVEFITNGVIKKIGLIA